MHQPSAHKDPPSLQPTSWRELKPAQRRAGLAAWLGWLFDGLDMHLYTVIAAPFVAQLMMASSPSDPTVKTHSAYIQAAFLIGWALGGAFFGRVGDLLGRSKALSLTVLTYALFTGLGFFAETWWQLLIFRFLAALGIGGEWAVGSSLLSETWPKKWRPWIAAVLQTGVNLGVLLAALTTYLLASYPPRYVFLVGILPAFLVFWIRKAVPETEEWHAARKEVKDKPPRIADLFKGRTRKITLLTIVVCSTSLTGWWAFMFWNTQYMRSLPDLAAWAPADRERLVSMAFSLVIGSSILGNFFAGWLAKTIGYRFAIMTLFFGFVCTVFGTYGIARDHESLMRWIPLVGFCSGVFGLFTMYLPPLFPTLLRTTGAGFSYNIGRFVSAGGTIFFGLYSNVSDLRHALFLTGVLFIPAMIAMFFMPDLDDSR